MSTVKTHTDSVSKHSTVKSRRVPTHIGISAPVPLWNGRLWLDTTNTSFIVLKIYDVMSGGVWKTVHIIDILGDIRDQAINVSAGLKNTTIVVPNGSLAVLSAGGLNTASLFYNTQIPSISGRWYDMLLDGGSKSNPSFTLTADTIYAVPFYVARVITFDRWSLDLTTAIGLSQMRFAIYSIGSNGLPNILVLESGVIASTSTGTDIGEDKSITLEPGWYVKCVWSNSAIAVNTVDSASGGRLLGVDRPDRNCSHSFTKSLAFGDYPDSFGTPGYKRTNDPIALRFKVG